MIGENWSLNTVQILHVLHFEPKIWRKIQKIGGVLTLGTLTFRMYDTDHSASCRCGSKTPHHWPVCCVHTGFKEM